MQTKFKIVNYNGGLDTWLNSISKDNWHFFKIEPFLHNVTTKFTIETGKFLVSAKCDPSVVSLYHSKFICNASDGAQFDFARMAEMDEKLSKCGFELIDYKPVFSLRREEGNWISPPMRGYLFLWGITRDSAEAANLATLSERVWDRLQKNDPCLPEKAETPDEFMRIVNMIVNLEAEARQALTADISRETLKADVDEISEELSYSNSKEFVEELLWRIEGNIIYKRLHECHTT